MAMYHGGGDNQSGHGMNLKTGTWNQVSLSPAGGHYILTLPPWFRRLPCTGKRETTQFVADTADICLFLSTLLPLGGATCPAWI